MENLTINDRIFILKTYYQFNENIDDTEKAIKKIFNLNAPSKLFIREFIDNFHKTGSVMFKKLYDWPTAIIATINGIICTNLEFMMWYMKESDLTSPIYSKKFLEMILNMFKIKLKKPLESNDHQKRRILVRWYIDQRDKDYLFYQKIIFTDIAYFHLNKTVESHNGYVLITDKNKSDISTPTSTDKIAVWCGFWSGGVIGPYFFSNDKNINSTDRYCLMLSNFLWTKLQDNNLDKVWFQKGDFSNLDENRINNLLKEKFDDRVVSPNGPKGWPKRSCDLNPCVYFLWGFVKAYVYSNELQSINHMMKEIQNCISLVTPEMCNDVLKNLDERMDIVNRSFGAHLPNIIYFR